MADFKAKRMTKKVRFNEKVEVFLIPSKNEERELGSDWIRFSQVKPLLNKSTNLKKPCSCNLDSFHENNTAKHHQKVKDSIDFYLRRTDKTSCDLANTKPSWSCTARVETPRDGRFGSYRRQIGPKTPFRREGTFPSKHSPKFNKSVANLSPLCRGVFLGSRAHDQFSEILAIYGNNPRLTTAKSGFSANSGFSEPIFVPGAVSRTEVKTRCSSIELFPYFKRSTPLLRSVQTACSVVPHQRNLKGENNVSWKWLYL